MSKIAFRKGKRSRNELYLPALRYVVADDWIDKLGHDAFVAWLKFHTWVDRRDEEREYDRVPYTLQDTWEKLGMKRKKFYAKVLKPLWEHWLIDIVEYDDSKRKAQKPKNIIVYESPQNKHETEIQPLQKLRDWEKDYGSPSQIFGRKGGQIVKAKSQRKTTVSDPLQTERVENTRSKQNGSTRSKQNGSPAPNGAPIINQISNNKTNNHLNNESNNHHLKKSDDDASQSDYQFLAFREAFMKAGAADIRLPEKQKEYYAVFKSILNEMNYSKLLAIAESYIEAKGKDAQILWFLSDGWRNYMNAAGAKKVDLPEKKPTVDPLASKKNELESLKRALAAQENADSPNLMTIKYLRDRIRQLESEIDATVDMPKEMTDDELKKRQEQIKAKLEKMREQQKKVWAGEENR